MSLLDRFIDTLFWWRNTPPRPEENLFKFLCRWEKILILLQKLLFGHNPLLNFVCLVCFNVVFWAVVYLEIRFYGFIFLSLLIGAGIDLARHHGLLEPGRGFTVANMNSPSEESFRVLTMDELHDHIRSIQQQIDLLNQKIWAFRQQQAGCFCTVVCGGCLALILLGRAVSGPMIIYSLISTILTLPALLVKFPQFVTYLPSLTANVAVEEEEYLPPRSEASIRILDLGVSQEEPSNDSLFNTLRSPEADSLYPDLSHEPLDYLELDAAIPSPRQVDADSEESDVSETHELQFKKKHFNGNGSSSSSGEELSKGLRFRGATVQRGSSSESNDSFEFVSKEDL